MKTKAQQHSGFLNTLIQSGLDAYIYYIVISKKHRQSLNLGSKQTQNIQGQYNMA